MRLKLALENRTQYRGSDLRALISRAVLAAGWANPQRLLVVEVVYARGGFVTGRARIGESGKDPGAWMRLRLPNYNHGWILQYVGDTVERQVALVALHEAMHLVGARHKDMTPNQLHCTGPMPKWAEGLQLREQEAKLPEEREAAFRANRLEHAQAMLRKAETRAKRAETIRTKWRRRVAALERGNP
jgi:hypothetical protein